MQAHETSIPVCCGSPATTRANRQWGPAETWHWFGTIVVPTTRQGRRTKTRHGLCTVITRTAAQPRAIQARHRLGTVVVRATKHQTTTAIAIAMIGMDAVASQSTMYETDRRGKPNSKRSPSENISALHIFVHDGLISYFYVLIR